MRAVGHSSGQVLRSAGPWLRARLRRALPVRVGYVGVFVVGAWALVLGECALVLVYPSSPSLNWQIAGLLMAVPATALAVSVGAALTRLVRTRLRYAALMVLLAGSLPPVAALRMVGSLLWVFVSIACLVALPVVALLPAGGSRLTPRPRRELALAGAVAGLALVPWLVAFAVALPAPVEQDGDGVAVWNLLLLSAAALMLSAYGGEQAVAVGKAVPRRLARVLQRLPDVSLRVLLLMLAAKALYVAVRVTAMPDLFGDGTLWRFLDRSVISWLHAVVLAGFIVLVAHHSARRPLSREGMGPAVIAMLAVAAFGVLVDLVDSAALWGWLIVDPGATEQVAREIMLTGPFSSVSLDLTLVGALGLGAVGVVRWAAHGLDAGVIVLVLAGLYIAPLAWNGLASNPPGMALPTQVDVVATVAVAGLLLARSSGNRFAATPLGPPTLSNRDLARLLIAPFVAVHAADLVPQAWERDLVQELAVGFLVVGALSLPPVAADPVRRARVLLAVVGVELVTLTALLLMVVTGNEALIAGLSQFGQWAVLLAAVPLLGLVSSRLRSEAP
jgi:hypothetical protein